MRERPSVSTAANIHAAVSPSLAPSCKERWQKIKGGLGQGEYRKGVGRVALSQLRIGEI